LIQLITLNRSLGIDAPDPTRVASTLEKSGRLGLDLKDGRAEDNSRVIEGGLDVLGGDEDVGLALDGLGDGGGDGLALNLALDADNTEAVDEGDV
jgi:hypothetical protein